MGYGGVRGYYWSHTILTEVEDEGVPSGTLEKQCLTAEARADEAKK